MVGLRAHNSNTQEIGAGGLPQIPGQLEIHGKTVTKMVTKTERKKKREEKREEQVI